MGGIKAWGAAGAVPHFPGTQRAASPLDQTFASPPPWNVTPAPLGAGCPFPKGMSRALPQGCDPPGG